MRNDSIIFLKRLLEYRKDNKQNVLKLNYQYFIEIADIKVQLNNIIRDLIENNCLASSSRVIDMEGNIEIALTLEGIAYFDKTEKGNESVVYNVYGGQVNVVSENGQVKNIISDAKKIEENRNNDSFVQSVEDFLISLNNNSKIHTEDAFEAKLVTAVIDQWMNNEEEERENNKRLVLEKFWEMHKE